MQKLEQIKKGPYAGTRSLEPIKKVQIESHVRIPMLAELTQEFHGN